MSVGGYLLRARHARTLDDLAAIEREAGVFFEHAPSEGARDAGRRGVRAALDAALERLCAAEASR